MQKSQNCNNRLRHTHQYGGLDTSIRLRHQPIRPLEEIHRT
jgi:hypothetical protein